MRSIIVALLAVVVAVPAFARESAVQVTQQGPELVLIQKDVGTERWAITLSLEAAAPLELTGNVFRSAGGPAVFLQCRPIDVLNGDAPVPQRIAVYNCFVAGGCFSTPCDPGAWSFLQTVNIPMSFFLP